MASMRDKLMDLIGKKVIIENSAGYVFIKLIKIYSDDASFHQEIAEVGDDYFVVKEVWKGKEYQDRNRETTYAISGLKSIQGGL